MLSCSTGTKHIDYTLLFTVMFKCIYNWLFSAIVHWHVQVHLQHLEWILIIHFHWCDSSGLALKKCLCAICSLQERNKHVCARSLPAAMCGAAPGRPWQANRRNFKPWALLETAPTRSVIIWTCYCCRDKTSQHLYLLSRFTPNTSQAQGLKKAQTHLGTVPVLVLTAELEQSYEQTPATRPWGQRAWTGILAKERLDSRSLETNGALHWGTVMDSPSLSDRNLQTGSLPCLSSPALFRVT